MVANRPAISQAAAKNAGFTSEPRDSDGDFPIEIHHNSRTHILSFSHPSRKQESLPMPLETIIASGCMGLATALLAWAGAPYYVHKFDHLEDSFREKLRRIRIPTTSLRQLLIGWFVAIGLLFLSLWVVMNLLVLGFVICALLLYIPWYLVQRMAARRRLMIEDQLADSMVSLSSAIKAGLSLAQALEILADQSPKPIGQEFQQMIGEFNLGKPLDQVLEETKDRLRSENFALFAAAMQASRESGGRLNETVDRIAHSVRELQRLERKVQTETSQARKSAVYMALAPLAILAMYYFFVDPVSTARLFTTLPGQIIVSVALVFNVVAYLWARKLLSPDI